MQFGESEFGSKNTFKFLLHQLSCSLAAMPVTASKPPPPMGLPFSTPLTGDAHEVSSELFGYVDKDGSIVEESRPGRNPPSVSPLYFTAGSQNASPEASSIPGFTKSPPSLAWQTPDQKQGAEYSPAIATPLRSELEEELAKLKVSRLFRIAFEFLAFTRWYVVVFAISQ